MKDRIEEILLAGMKIAKRNPEMSAYEALRMVYNNVKHKDADGTVVVPYDSNKLHQP